VIALLRGELIDRGGGSVIVDCGGVGYQVWVSACTANALPARGELVALRVYTHFYGGNNDSRIALFGFATPEERDLFDLLITVKRVGPTAAVKILSAGATPHEIAQLIAAEKASALSSIKGVGKKTAEMLVVELREKCEMLLAGWGASGALASIRSPRPGTDTGADLDPLAADVLSALVKLGWRPAEAEKALASVELPTDATLESALRQTLAAMPR
jgi:Holliday junction DNA helicase RuvA